MKKILLFLAIVSLVIPFVPAQAEDSFISNQNEGIFLRNKGLENQDLEFLQVGSKEYTLKIGESIAIGGVDWIRMVLFGLPGNHPGQILCKGDDDCADIINNSAGVSLLVNDDPQSIYIKKGEKLSMWDGVFTIFFVGLDGENSGRFSVLVNDLKDVDDKPVESYEVYKAPIIGSKDVILISEEEISIKEINEGGEVIKIAPKSGVKQVILIESDSEKLPVKELDDTTEPISGQDKREVLVGVSEGEVSIEVIKGVTKEDCEAYKEKCEETGNQIVCLKWGDICETPDYDSNQCSEIISLCNEGDEGACKKYSIACKIISSATTKEVLNIKENKIFMNEKEIKVMPDTASENAIKKLSLKKDVEIELKDTGKPVYEVIGSQEKRIFGLFKTAVKVTTTLSAETGEIEKTKKPWWSFLAW